MRIQYIALALVTLVGCSKRSLTLTTDSSNNINAVAAYVPAGTDRTTAVELMSKAGFTCRVIENGVVVDAKPNDKGSSKLIGKSINVILCDRRAESAGGLDHQVILYLDSSGRVERCGISSGPSGQ